MSDKPAKQKPNPLLFLDGHAADHIHLTIMVFVLATTLVMTVVASSSKHEIKSFFAWVIEWIKSFH